MHHVGIHATLEDQMTTWQPFLKGERSPDRVDALCWGISALMLEAEDATFGKKQVIAWNGRRRLAR